MKTEKLGHVLRLISDYANEHSLTPEQIKEIFNEGISVCHNAGRIKLPRYVTSSDGKMIQI